MCTQFIGRKQELESLEKAYQKKGFQMCILYGRRRVGKTSLISAFIKEKKHISFTAIQGSLSRNIELLSDCVTEYLYPDAAGLKLPDFSSILTTITKATGNDRLIIAIDEFPYLAESEPSLLSLLQREIDLHWQRSNIFLILSGSSISFMLDQVLSYKSPLYGRRTMQIDLKPFNYLEVAEFVPGYSPEEKAICYGVTGGIAKYIAAFDSDKTLDENITDLYFSPSGLLYEEPRNLLMQEFKNAPIYSDVIAAIANGANKPTEIKDKTGMEAASIHNILRHLLETRIIEKCYCITEENNKKKVQYTLADGMFLFWHRFIPHAIPQIEIDNGDTYYKNIVKPKLHEYMGSIFERMCQFYILKNFHSEQSHMINAVGKWFGTDPKRKIQTDIDIVGLDTSTNKAVIGECKFRNSVIDKSVMDELLLRKELINNKYQIISYYLFSLSGFSDWIQENAAKMNIIPVSLDAMY